jgi:ligand-binding sensor domain-containing protein/signal transduction histidine kinase
MKRKAVFLGVLVMLAHISFCQYHTYTTRNYKAIDGLPQSQVNIMLEDKHGYLWIGTEGGGLARFDGRQFKVYTTLDGLLSNIVTYLKLDKHQNLWIIHPRGITKFDGLTFKKFQQPGLPANTKRIRRAFEVQDTLFFISAPGHIGKIHHDSLYYWSKPAKDHVLVGYSHLGPQREVVLFLSDSSFLIRTSKEDHVVDHKKYFNRIVGLPFNYQNKIWIKSDSGYYTINADNKGLTKTSFDHKNHVVFYDSLNDVFWTRNGNYLLREKISANHSEVDTVLKDVEIRQVLVDSEGNTWLASDGSGLYKYFIQDFDRCSSENMRGVMAIHVDRGGATWIGSMTKGLWKIKKNKISSYIDKKEVYRNAINVIRESPDGVIWVGTSYGLGKYDADTDSFRWYTREDGLRTTSISSLAFDEHGNLWVGTFSGGVNFYDGKNFRAYTVRDGLSTNMVYSLCYSHHYKKLFIGSEFGIAAISNGRLEQLAIGGIENTTVISMNVYQDSLLLIGTAGAGVVVYNPKTRSKKLITTHHGLPSDFTYFVAPDPEQYVWIGTEKGITRTKINDDFEITENLHYDYDNGLTGVETNQNAFYLSKENKYFGLIDGLYQFNDFKRDRQKCFDLHLTDVQILYGQQSVRQYADSLSGFFKIPLKLRLPPDKNHITFYFNRVDKRYPKSVKFKYFLENFDKAWSQPSHNNGVTYSNLPPGDYVFKVMATSNEGTWLENQVVYPFTIKTPFYQTASFIVGLFILLAGSVTLILYLRVKQRVNKVMVLERIRAKEQETLRKEIARDFHDEMGNQLTRIINYVSLLKLNGNGNGNGNGNHADLYAKVEDSAKYLYTGTRDFIWSIDPVNDELSKLFLHIRDFGEKLFEEKQINFRAFNEVKEKTKLPYGFSREANLIFKEVMTNAFKYSKAANVKLSLHRLEDSFEMTFEDDGVGFFTGEIQKFNGLKNIRERADRINAVLRIQSVKNEGTKIVLGFKLNKTLKYGLAL